MQGVDHHHLEMAPPMQLQPPLDLILSFLFLLHILYFNYYIHILSLSMVGGSW